ncbi:hypothetical protein VIGAN_08141900 [Vigna angularis var. angularis]|uniref:Uncharacterized protein n=1 Tax=Vigna angularis var. angularis TaxID=157739 RepID=A0A0S3SPN8_PHAAN|nr:hypothetical protein VIGAN_08141900 [Vigna angularis var. angularis]
MSTATNNANKESAQLSSTLLQWIQNKQRNNAKVSVSMEGETLIREKYGEGGGSRTMPSVGEEGGWWWVLSRWWWWASGYGGGGGCHQDGGIVSPKKHGLERKNRI